MFQFRHVNRLKYPQKHILICEDDLTNQSGILNHFLQVFEPQGIVQFSVVPGALAASALITYCKIDLIILDHDMPEGNGSDLIMWIQANNRKIPIITFSDVEQNNVNMMIQGANYHFDKSAVLEGKADDLIKKILKLEEV